MYTPCPPDWWMATDLASNTTYIAERARRGSRKLNFSRMPRRGPGGDELVNRARVPLYLRRAAYTHFNVGTSR